MFIFMCILHHDSSALPLTQELYTFHTLRLKHLDHSISYIYVRGSHIVMLEVRALQIFQYY